MTTHSSSLPSALMVGVEPDGDDAYFVVSSVKPALDWLALHFEIARCGDGTNDVLKALHDGAPEIIIVFCSGKGLSASSGTFNDEILTLRRQLKIPLVIVSVMDAHDRGKTLMTRCVDRWDADAVFCLDIGNRELMGGYGDLIMHSPWFVPEDYCQNFGEEKVIDLAMIGSGFDNFQGESPYPWRVQAWQQLKDLPQMFSTSTQTESEPYRLIGEDYGRKINQARISLACTSARFTVTKKHFEIPACHSCLLCDPSPLAEELGFENGVNCLVSDESAIAVTAQAALMDLERLEEITNAGYDFVWNNHRAVHRTQVNDWLAAYKQTGCRSRIVQQGVTSEIVSLDSKPTAKTSDLRSPFAQVYERTMNRLWDPNSEPGSWAGDLNYLNKSFARAPETEVANCLAACRSGDFDSALEQINQSVREAMRWRAFEPDPMVWGLVLLVHQLAGRHEALTELGRCFPDLHSLPRNVLNGTESKPTRTFLYVPGFLDAAAIDRWVKACHASVSCRPLKQVPASWGQRLWRRILGSNNPPH